MSAQEKATNEVTPVENVKVSEVLAMLAEGKDRKAIAAHYGQSVALMARTVWQHPKLKGRRVITPNTDNITVIDDTEDEQLVLNLTNVEDTVQVEAVEGQPETGEEEVTSPTPVSQWGA
jgi:hypothetical protein